MTDATDPIALLKALIQRPSVTPDDEGVLDVVAEALEGAGFAVTRLRFEGDGSYPVDNLFATRGSGSPHLLFAGHTDVVPPGDAALWTHPPFAAEEANGAIFGRGAADMKSGVAAFVSAAVSLAPGHSGTVSLAITNDEEADSVNGTEKILKWAGDQGHRFDFSIVGEPSARASVGDSIKIGRRGSLNGQVTITGTQGHSAYPERANNPVPVMAALITALSDTRLDHGTERFPPSNLEVTSADVGNKASNVIPAGAVLKFNVRFNETWSTETLEAWIMDRIASVDPRGCSIDYERKGTVSRVFVSPVGPGIDALIRTIETVTGRAPELATFGGTSDARFIASYCPVVECGLVGTTMHKVDEMVRVDDVIALTALYRRFLGHYLAGDAL